MTNTETALETPAMCEACAGSINVGDKYFGGEQWLCAVCAPKFKDLADPNELVGFVEWGDQGWEPMSADRAAEIYRAHIAAGGKPTDSMAIEVME